MVVYVCRSVPEYQCFIARQIGEWKKDGGLKINMDPIWTHALPDPPSDKPSVTEVKLRLGVLEDPPFIIYNYTRGPIKYNNCSGIRQLHVGHINIYLSELEIDACDCDRSQV